MTSAAPDYMLSTLPYEHTPFVMPALPKRRKRGPEQSEQVRFEHTIPQRF